MDLYEYAWSLCYQVCQKNHGDVRVVFQDSIEHPVLTTDSTGHLTYFPRPRVQEDGSVSFLGLRYRNSDAGLNAFWRMLRASASHLGAHVAVSDFGSYSPWLRAKDTRLAMFARSLVEDAFANAYLRTHFEGLLLDLAYANLLSYLKLKPPSRGARDILRVQSALVSNLAVGRVKDTLEPHMERAVKDLTITLRNSEARLMKQFPPTKEASVNKFAVEFSEEEKLSLAEEIYWTLIPFGHPTQVVSLPYAESFTRCDLFQSAIKASRTEKLDILRNAYAQLGLSATDAELNHVLDGEVEQDHWLHMMSSWVDREERNKQILTAIAKLSRGTHFRSIRFPNEDYAQFLRSRRGLAAVIRRALDELMRVKTLRDDREGFESGLVNIQEGIRIIASESPRRDYFDRFEPMAKSEGWAILIDASKSLRTFAGEVRGVALCLAEVARKLISNPSSWGLYAFDDSFYVVKDFSEKYSKRVCSRIGGLTHSGRTYLPDALKVTGQLFNQASSDDLRVLVAVTDGCPMGYDGIEDDLSEAVKCVEASGVNLAAMGINHRGVKKYFRNSVVIERPYDMLRHFIRLYLELASSA